MTKPYSLYRRKTGRKIVYYVRFRDPATDERLSGMSTHCDKKADAERFVIDYLKKGKLQAKSKVSFRNYTEGFFDYDSSPYIKSQLANGSRYTHTYADSNRGILNKHLVPRFGDKLLSSIRVVDIEQFMDEITEKGYGSTTLKNILSVLSAILSEAYRTEVLSMNPMERVRKRVPRYRQKEPIPREIIKELFSPALVDINWKKDSSMFLLNFTALATGMRQGEIQALRWGDIKEDHIELKYKWDRKYGLTEPKYGSSRTIPLPPVLKKLFSDFYSINASTIQLDSFVFNGRIKNKPFDHKYINSAFYYALKQIGIDDTKRKEMNITFHSWRHTFASMMRGKISDSELKLLTGHKSDEMIDHYTHYSMDKLKEVVPVQEEVFGEYLLA
jgi:integrase